MELQHSCGYRYLKNNYEEVQSQTRFDSYAIIVIKKLAKL